MYEKPNVLIAGASGGVGNALLHHLAFERDLFGKLVLLDRNKRVLEDTYINHEKLAYEFVQFDLKLPENLSEYQQILVDHEINIVVDVTDGSSRDILDATNASGVSYLNTAMNGQLAAADITIPIYDHKKDFSGAPHIVCSGMNPGVVNMWVRFGIEKFGVPKEVTHFEYDTSKVMTGWEPMMTWSLREFLIECVRDPGGVVHGRGKDKVEYLLPNGLENRKNLKSILEPIMKLPEYPEGMLDVHDENLSIAQKYDIPSRFIYAIHQKTLRMLIDAYEKKGTVSKEDLILGDNTSEALEGADSIGVLLEYDDKRVYYFNTVPSVAIIGTNATYTQVIIGIMAALHVFLTDTIENGVHFPEDLWETCYRHFIFDNMRVQEFVFNKHDGHLKLASFNPMLKTHKRGYKHDYII